MVAGRIMFFAEGYDLRSLEEVKSFIEEKGHLPEFASAAEIEKEKGVDLQLTTVAQQQKDWKKIHFT